MEKVITNKFCVTSVYDGEDGRDAAALEISPNPIVFNGDSNGAVSRGGTATPVTVQMRVGGGSPVQLRDIVAVTTPPGVEFRTYSSGSSQGGAAPSNLGTLRYRVGLISDPHYNAEGDDTEFAGDIENAMDYFDSLASMAFSCCCGDVCDTMNEDLVMFTRLWANKAKCLNGAGWPSGGKTGFQLIRPQGGIMPKPSMRLMTCLGNHDVRQVFGQTSNGYNDPRTGNKWNGVARLKYLPDSTQPTWVTTWEDEGQRPGLTASDQWTNEYNNPTNRDYSVENLKEYIGEGNAGESDIYFLGYDDIWNPGAGWGIYNSVTAASGGWSIRSMRSKMNFYHVKGSDLFVFISADYGTDPNVDQCWRFDHAINLLDMNDAYAQQVESYVIQQENALGDPNKYSRAAEYGFNYQIYDCRALLFLKKVLEDNYASKRIFVFSHHYFPHKAGNGKSNAHVDGGTGYYCSKDHVRPFQSPMDYGSQCGSYDLCGVQFHFLNVLNRLYPKAVWFTGHSHFIWQDKDSDPFMNFCDGDFDYKKPTANDSATNYNGSSGVPAFYTRTSDDRVAKTAWNVHLPSLSRPKTLSTGQEMRKGNWSQGAVMEVYDDYVKIIGLSFKDDGSGGGYYGHTDGSGKFVPEPREITNLIVRKSDGKGWVDGYEQESASSYTDTPLVISGDTAAGTITAEGARDAVEGLLTVTLRDVSGNEASGSATVTVHADTGGQAGPPGAEYKVLSEKTFYCRTASSSAPAQPTTKSPGSGFVDGSGNSWSVTPPIPYVSEPFVWKCTFTTFQLTAVDFRWGDVEPFETYQPQTRILTYVEWEAFFAPGADNRIYRGDPGEPYKDLYLDTHQEAFYECIKSGNATPYIAPGGTGSWEEYWKAGTYFASVGVGLLAVVKAHVKELVVGMLQTEMSQDGICISISGGLMRATYAASNQYAEFGVRETADGTKILCLNFYKDGDLLLALGPDDIYSHMTVRESAYEAVSAKRSASSNTGGTKLNPATTGDTIYRFTEGIQSVGGVKKYAVSQSTKPSVFDAKYLAQQYSDATLRGSSSTLQNRKAQDGWYLYEASGGTAREMHVVDGVVTERNYIKYNTRTYVINEWGPEMDYDREA